MLPYPAKTTREIMLALFLSHTRLTARQAWSKARQEFSRSVSYKTVYKVLQEMQGQGQILKHDKYYCLSSTWVLKVKVAVSAAEKRLST